MIRVLRNPTLPIACTKIEFRGFEISIAGMNYLSAKKKELRETDLEVLKDGQNVTTTILKIHGDTDSQSGPSSEDLYKVMRAIADLKPS